MSTIRLTTPQSAAAPVAVSDDIKQAFWRIIQQGNDYWVKYWQLKTDPRGTNDRKVSTGYIDGHGKDRTHDAGTVWFYTAAKVDEHKLCFGPWSIRADGTRHWIAYDIEPLATATHQKLTETTAEHRQRVRDYARRCYNTWKMLAQLCEHILAVALIETSPNHYHVWVLLDEPIDQAQHDQMISEAERSLPSALGCLDKHTGRGRRGKGDHFRAPWTWRAGTRSEALALWLRDPARLIELGDKLRPGGLRLSPSKYHSVKRTEQPVEYYAQIAAIKWPLSLRGDQGTRHRQQGRLIAALRSRGLEPDIIKQVGRQWLSMFHTPDSLYFLADYDSAVRDFDADVDHTIQKATLQPATTAQHYLEQARSIQLTPTQEGFLQCCTFTQSSSTRIRGGEDHKLVQYRPTAVDRLVLEALIVIARVELAKLRTGSQPAAASSTGKVCFTRDNINEYLEVRGKKKLQTQDLSTKYLPRFIKRKDDDQPKVHLLTRTLVGRPGFASEYELTPLFQELLRGD